MLSFNLAFSLCVTALPPAFAGSWPQAQVLLLADLSPWSAVELTYLSWVCRPLALRMKDDKA